MLLTAHKERRHEIYTDERYADIYGATKRSHRGHGGRHVAHETEHRFAAHPVSHHARDNGEHGHQDERGRKVRHHRSGVVLQFDVQGPGAKSSRGYVMESSCVLCLAYRIQKRFFPDRTSIYV